MKKIGFIDIHSGDVVSGSCKKLDENEQFPDNTLIYIFDHHSGKNELEKTLEYSSDDIPEDISEFYLSIPVELLNFRIINLPYSDKEKLGKSIPLELESLIADDFENIVFDTIVLKDEDSGFDILVTYAGKNSLDTLIEKLTLKNIDPRVITSIDLSKIILAGEDKCPLAERLACRDSGEKFDRIGAAANELFTPTINLRSGPLAYTKDITRKNQIFNKTVILIFLLALFINANLFFDLVMTNKEISAQKSILRNGYSALFPDEKKIIDETYQLKSHIREMKKRSDVLTGVNPLGLLIELSQKPVAQVIYNEILLGKGFIKMKAEAASTNAVDKARERYSEFLSDVLLSDIKPATDGKIFFTVAATEKSR